MSEVVNKEVEGGIAVLTLNRPERLNAWTVEMERDYFAMLDECASSDAVRVIVVTGSGRGFCAGADMQDLQDLGDGNTEGREREDRTPQRHPLGIPKPIIAAINGLAWMRAMFWRTSASRSANASAAHSGRMPVSSSIW